MIKAITFDLWNTIFKNKSYSEYRLDFLIKFLQNKKINYNYEKIKHVYDNYFRGTYNNLEDLDFRHIYNEERILNLFNTLEIKISNSDKDYIKKEMEKTMLKDSPSLKKDVKATLKMLSPNYKIGLISNTGITPGGIIIKVFKQLEILKYFQVTIFSDEIGFYKPKSIIFEIALDKLKCKPEHAIHVGDLLQTDIEGAKAYGMRTIWFNDKNQPKILDIKPDYEIKEMCEIIPIINNLN